MANLFSSKNSGSKFELKKGKNKLVAVVTIFVLILGLTATYLFGDFNEKDVSHASGNFLTITPNVANVSSSGNIAIAYSPANAMVIGSTITLSYNSDYTGTISTSNTTLNGVAPSNVVNSTSGNTTTSVLTLAAINAVNVLVTISTSALTTPVTAGNYIFSVTPLNNIGKANFQYVGDLNSVQVKAFVPISLSFDIRNETDTINTNICDLGTVTVNAISACSYRLKVVTNAKNGYAVSTQFSGNLVNSDGSYTVNNSSSFFDTPIPGIESYVISITNDLLGYRSYGWGGSMGGGNVIPHFYLNVDSKIGGDWPVSGSFIITHKLAISPSTPAGSYTQKLTYTVTPSF
jgi:hypothetical protein